MSVLNGRAYLSEAIESILAQTLGDFEFVIIDDGSSDDTPDILAKFATQDGRVRIIRHENKGRSISLNIGMGTAEGTYIARMDADDIAMPYRLSEQFDFMERHVDIGLLGGAVELIDPLGRSLQAVTQPLNHAEIQQRMLERCALFHPTVMMRKEIALSAGGYRKIFREAEDYDLWLRLAERTKIANLSRVFVRYRIHARQVSLSNMQCQILCVLAAQAAAQFRKKGLLDPLYKIDEVNAQAMSVLGVSREEMQAARLRAYRDWIEVVERCDRDAGLRLSEEFVNEADSRYIDKKTLANARLKIASTSYQKRQITKALLSTAQAAWLRPSVVGRPIKNLFRRLFRLQGAAAAQRVESETRSKG